MFVRKALRQRIKKPGFLAYTLLVKAEMENFKRETYYVMILMLRNIGMVLVTRIIIQSISWGSTAGKRTFLGLKPIDHFPNYSC